MASVPVKERVKVSQNWRLGRCRERILLKWRCSQMPWMQLEGDSLYISQANFILAYQFRPDGASLNRRPLGVFAGHDEDVCHFVLANSHIISAGGDGKIGVHKIHSTFTVKYSAHEQEVNCVDCRGGIIVSGSRDRTAKVWSLASGRLGQCLHTIQTEDRVWSIAISPLLRIEDGGVSCPPVPGNLVNRWTPSCPEVLPKGSVGGARVTLVQVLLGSDCSLVSRPCLVVINLGHGPAEAQPGQLWSLTVKTFGSETELISVACFGNAPTAQLWKGITVQHPAACSRRPFLCDGFVTFMQLKPERLASLGLRVVHLEVIFYGGRDHAASSFVTGTACCGHFSPLRIWDLNSGQLMTHLGSDFPPGAGVLDLMYESPFTLLSCGYDTYVRYWDLRASVRKCVMEWEEPHDSTLYCLQTDGNHLLATGSSYYGVVRLWDRRQRACLHAFPLTSTPLSSPVYCLRFTTKHLYAALSYNLHVLDFQNP
ncbi:F-box/WD repeat-containing protein 4 [Myotis davidii]|uniref:F-box/WD repeat-containing protein 4 n=1 Tax=Myotis davidii TaxID=225400 RepID=L5MAK1_MYODS|nr:F-box/WD repeat-containing protein 4 [Myotis davidii]